MKDFFRACLFELFYLGFAVIGIVILSMGITSASLLMFFLGLSIAGVSIFERLSIKKEDNIPNLFVSIEKMLTELKERRLAKQKGKAAEQTKVAEQAKPIENEKKKDNFAQQIVKADVAQGQESGKFKNKTNLKNKENNKTQNKTENNSKEEGKGK